jgi:hypothetical protein
MRNFGSHVGHVAALGRPHGGVGCADARFQHVLVFVLKQPFIASDRLGFLLQQQRHVWVFLEAVANAGSERPGGKISDTPLPSRRKPPKEYIRIAVAMRMAGRFTASRENSFARYSSMRRARAFAPMSLFAAHIRQVYEASCHPPSSD